MRERERDAGAGMDGGENRERERERDGGERADHRRLNGVREPRAPLSRSPVPGLTRVITGARAALLALPPPRGGYGLTRWSPARGRCGWFFVFVALVEVAPRRSAGLERRPRRLGKVSYTRDSLVIYTARHNVPEIDFRFISFVFISLRSLSASWQMTSLRQTFIMKSTGSLICGL